MLSERYRFGAWVVEPTTNRLHRETETQQIEPLAMDVLVLLLEHHGQVVSADQVLDSVWSGRHGDPGMVKKRIGQLRAALGDDAKYPIYIETIPKRGYRAIGRLETVDDTHSGSSGFEKIPAQDPAPSRSIRLPVMGTLLASALAIAIYFWLGPSPDPQAPSAGNRIAINSFQLAAPDEQLRQLGNRYHDELTHELSQLLGGDWYLATGVDEADFHVSGKVSHSAEGARLFVKVIDSSAQTLLWTTTLDLSNRPEGSALAISAEKLATKIWFILPVGQAANALTESPEAVREYLNGMLEYLSLVQGSKGDWDAARAYFERASELDPGFIRPVQMLGVLYQNRLGSQLRYIDAVDRAHYYAQRILALDPDSTNTLGMINTVLDFDHRAALANIEHSRQAGRSANIVEFSLAVVQLHMGQLDQAINGFETSLQLGALSNQAAAYNGIASAHFAAGRYQDAVSAGANAVAHSSGTGLYAHLGALKLQTMALFHSGDIAGAKKALGTASATYRAQNPEMLVAAWAILGEPELARSVLAAANARWEAGSAFYAGECFWAHFYLGELPQAFLWLNRAIDDRQAALLPALRRSPLLDPIRQDPRFIAVMERLAAIESQGTPTGSVAYSRRGSRHPSKS